MSLFCNISISTFFLPFHCTSCVSVAALPWLRCRYVHIRFLDAHRPDGQRGSIAVRYIGLVGFLGRGPKPGKLGPLPARWNVTKKPLAVCQVTVGGLTHPHSDLVLCGVSTGFDVAYAPPMSKNSPYLPSPGQMNFLRSFGQSVEVSFFCDPLRTEIAGRWVGRWGC